MKKLNKKGFTLAELLVVVAIIAVLVAIAIPVFSGALTKAEIAADKANVRAWYAEKVVNYLTKNSAYPSSYSGTTLNNPTYVSVDNTAGFTVTYSGTGASGSNALVLTAAELN